MMKEPERRETDCAGLNRRHFLELSVAGTVSAFGSYIGKDFALSAVPEKLNESPTEQERRNLVVTSWRTFESGFHNGPTVHFDRLDPERYMANVRKAHTEVVVIQTKSHWGYAYYDTKVGMRHPNLHYDLIARWVEAGHRNGLSVVAYYSGQVDTQSGLKYPYWVGRNADGSASWVGHRFAWCCHHSPYHNYALGMYREIFGRYDFDGLFIDGLPWPRWLPDPLCYCEWCMDRYEKDQSESFLRDLKQPEGYRRRLEWLQRSSAEYLDEVYQTVHSLRPDLPIWFNQGDPFDMSTTILKKAACLYVEPISSPSGLSVGAVVLRDWGRPGPQVGIFWSGYSGTPLDVDRFRTAAVVIQGVRPRFITDQQNMPDGRQRPGFYEWTNHLQSYVEEVEPFLRDLKPIPSLGIVFSEATRDHLTAVKRSALLGPYDFRDSMIGCLEILTRTQYPTGVIPGWKLNSPDLQQYDLIVLPEVDALSEAEGHVLKDYVRRGGKLLASWKPGLIDDRGKERANFLLADVLGVDYIEEIATYAGKDGPGIYLQSTGHHLSAALGTGEVGILDASNNREPAFCPFVKVHGPAENLADYRLPYLVPNLDKHIFDSWNPAPPGNEKIPQAATYNRYGLGATLYLGLPIFRRYSPELYWIGGFLCALIRQIVPDPAIRIEGDASIQAAFYRQGSNRLVIQLVNSAVWGTKAGKAAPARKIDIVGRSDRFDAHSAEMLWPEEQHLDFKRGQHWRTTVPNVALHAIVEVRIR